MVIYFLFVLHFILIANCDEGVPRVDRVFLNDTKVQAASSVILSPGSSLTLDCSISASSTREFNWYRQFFNSSDSAVPVDESLIEKRNDGKTLRLKIPSISYDDSSRLECRFDFKNAEVFVHVFSMEPKQNASLCVTVNETSSGLTDSLTTFSTESVTKINNCPLYVSATPNSIISTKTDYSSPSSTEEVCSRGGSTWLACACRVGSGTRASGAVIIWSGGRLQDHPEWYEDIQNQSADYIKSSYLRLRHISDIDQTVVGRYECKCNMARGVSITASVYLLSAPILVESPSLTIRAKEGSSLVVSCNYVAYPPPTSVQWYKENEPMDISITNTWSRNVPNTVKKDRNELFVVDDKNEGQFSLHFPQLSSQDRAKYKCVIINENGGNCRNIRLRVKDSMVVIWPLTGILLEVLFMFIIIVFYEIRQKRRRRAQSQEGTQAINSDSVVQPYSSPNRAISDEHSRTGMRLASESRGSSTPLEDSTRKRKPAARPAMNSTRL